MLPGHKAPPTRTTLCAPMFERGTCWADAPEPSERGSAEATTRSNRCAKIVNRRPISGPTATRWGQGPVLGGVGGCGCPAAVTENSGRRPTTSLGSGSAIPPCSGAQGCRVRALVCR